MPHCQRTAILLACLSVAIAHAGISLPTTNRLAGGHNPVVTSLLARQGVAAATARPLATLPLTASKASLLSVTTSSAAAVAAATRRRTSQQRERLDGKDSVNVRTPLSVVQAWSLVCQQQLCGAVDGGIPCAATGCTNASAKGNRAIDWRLMCQELCRLQIGDDVCQCNAKASQESLNADAANMCQLMCQRYAIAALIDCNACNPDTTQAPSGSVGLGLDLLHSKEQSNKGVALDEQVDEVDEDVDDDVVHDDDDVVHEDDDDVNEYDDDVNEDTDGVDVVAHDIVQNVNRFGDTETVGDESNPPDWSELCVSLCKTGDGGSLCSCDLSPFF